MKSPVASLCLACSSVKNLVKVTILRRNELALNMAVKGSTRIELSWKDCKSPLE